MQFMKDFVPALKSEIAELEGDIRDNPDPRIRKLERLRSTLAEYEPVDYVPQSNGKTAPLEPLPAAPGAKAATKAARMKGYIDGVLHGHLKIHRKSLLEGLIANGIMGKEADPMQALAIFLSSNKDDYKSDGEGNYSRREG
jgi:hypothetical protein